MGNRTDHNAAVITGNRYQSFNGASIGYDADGNMTQKYDPAISNRDFYWSAEGQLDSVVQNNWDRVRYDYNAFGKPVRKLRNSNAAPNWVVDSYFLWDGDQLLAEFDPSGNRRSDYLYFPGTVDQPFAHTVGATGPIGVRYHQQDAMGNVVGTMDNGNVSQTVSYDAWGNLGIAGNSDNRLFWKGLMWEGDIVGLYYNRSRWYDPQIGRFLSEDPVGHTGGINLYALAGNDPINGQDPSGLFRESCTTYYTVTYNTNTGQIFDILGVQLVCEGGATTGGSGGGGGVPNGPTPSTAKHTLPQCALFPYRPVNLGQQWGEDAAEYWAVKSITPNSPWYVKVGANVAGGFASLWTPETMDRTVSTLIGAYSLRVLGPFPTREMGKWAQQSRENIRIDPPHHGKGWHLDSNPRGPIDVFGCNG